MSIENCISGASWVVQWLKIHLSMQRTWIWSPIQEVVKNLPASAEDIRDAGLIPGSGRSSGGGHGNSLHYSCLENPIGSQELDMTEETAHTRKISYAMEKLSLCTTTRESPRAAPRPSTAKNKFKKNFLKIVKVEIWI